MNELLKVGYRVRGLAPLTIIPLKRSAYVSTGHFRTARSAKVAAVQQGFAQYGDRYEVVGVDDLIGGDFTDILKGGSQFSSPLLPTTSN